MAVYILMIVMQRNCFWRNHTNARTIESNTRTMCYLLAVVTFWRHKY